MHDNPTAVILIIAASCIFFAIGVLLFASVTRRAHNNRMYQELDRLRKDYRSRLDRVRGGEAALPEILRTKPGSLAWRAVEDVLLEQAKEGPGGGQLRDLFRELGYPAYYEGRLASRNAVIRASAADKLGRMLSRESLPRLIALLEDKQPEVVSVAVRALSRIGLREGLLAIMERLPELLGRSRVTRKAMETALLRFGDEAVNCLTAFTDGGNDPWIMSCVLETLSHLPPDPRSIDLARAYLGSPNAEVRSKALKVLARQCPAITSVCVPGQILPLLADPVWFVRLQAIKTLGELAGRDAAASIGKLLFDPNWRVRSEAARTLSASGDCSLDVFLDALRASDRYAKESICEEIQKTLCMDRLIEGLAHEDTAVREKCRDILGIMVSLRFCTPLEEYLEKGAGDRIKSEVRGLLAARATS